MSPKRQDQNQDQNQDQEQDQDHEPKAAQLAGRHAGAPPALKPHIYIYIYGVYLGAPPVHRVAGGQFGVIIKAAGHIGSDPPPGPPR